MTFLESIFETLESMTFCSMLVYSIDSKNIMLESTEHVYFLVFFFMQKLNAGVRYRF